MDYNWKYVTIKSARAFKVWRNWPSYAKIHFLELLREDFSNELRLFSCGCIERIIGKDFLENDKNDAINITRQAIQRRISLKRLFATKGRYRTPFDYDNLKINNGVDIRRGPDQMNIAWLRIMNRLCEKNAYDIATSITWLLEDYRVQPLFNQLRDSLISNDLFKELIDNNHYELEKIYNPELDKRFNYIFEKKGLEIYLCPGKVSYDLGIGPFFGTDLDTWKPIKEWSYGAWVFCVDSEIIR